MAENTIKFNSKDVKGETKEADKEVLAAQEEQRLKEFSAKRLENLTLKYGANQIYTIDRLPKPGFLYEYKDQMVVLTHVKEGTMESIMLSSIKPSKDYSNKYDVTGFDSKSNERKFLVDIVGAGKEVSTKNEVRIFPTSYAHFISETTIFHKDTLKRAWEKCKPISKLDFKSYQSDSGTALLNTTDNVGLIVKLADDDYLYIRIHRVEWNSKDKNFSIFHEAEEMNFPTPDNFGKGEFDFDNVCFRHMNFKTDLSKRYRFSGLKCKVIDLKDMCV